MMASSKLGDGNNNEGAQAESQVYVSKSGTRWKKPDQDLQQGTLLLVVEPPEAGQVVQGEHDSPLGHPLA